MEQMFGTNNHYVQDDGCGHEMIICALRPVNSSENTGTNMGRMYIQSMHVPQRREDVIT